MLLLLCPLWPTVSLGTTAIASPLFSSIIESIKESIESRSDSRVDRDNERNISFERKTQLFTWRFGLEIGWHRQTTGNEKKLSEIRVILMMNLVRLLLSQTKVARHKTASSPQKRRPAQHRFTVSVDGISFFFGCGVGAPADPTSQPSPSCYRPRPERFELIALVFHSESCDGSFFLCSRSVNLVVVVNRQLHPSEKRW